MRPVNRSFVPKLTSLVGAVLLSFHLNLDVAAMEANGVLDSLLAETVLLETGGDNPLSTRSIPVNFPASLPLFNLAFQLGFTTEENPTGDGFFDALSVTFQSIDRSKTVLLLVVDATGVAWAPENPGGTLLLDEAIVRETIEFPADLNPWGNSFAYDVILRLPAGLVGQAGVLYLDMFESRNGKRSKAYLRNLNVTTSSIVVESSSRPDGPYAEEGFSILNASASSITVLQMGHARYFRLRDFPGGKIVTMRGEGDYWSFQYQLNPGTPETQQAPALESSAQITGPYADEPETVVDRPRRTIRLLRVSPTRFYRLRSEVPLKIKRIEKVGDHIRLFFDLAPPF